MHQFLPEGQVRFLNVLCRDVAKDWLLKPKEGES